MQPKSATLLWDARRAAELIIDFVSSRTFELYESDAMFRSAVERQFQVIGEALNRLRQTDPETAELIPDLTQIVGFRNLIVHGYADVNEAEIWRVATTELKPLVDLFTSMLPEVPE
jgi:uncharacterized protein with HEPN domain